MKNKIFVYAVCGKREHIDTLNFSLRYLKHFTRNDIIVVTDERRNESKINHDHIINIQTPVSFTDKEASIFLKTRLPEILPEGNLYCYLDSDIIAVNERASEVFGHFKPPVTFARDHCTADEFSPWAIHCDCIQRDREKHERYLHLMDQYRQSEIKHVKRNIPEKEESRNRYYRLREVMTEYKWVTSAASKNFFLKWFLLLFRPYPYRFGTYLRRHGEFVWDRWRRRIYDRDGALLYDDSDPYPDFTKFVESHFTPDESRKILAENRAKDFFKVRCTHLHEAIQSKFNVDVNKKNWNHWNGGVFLFNDKSREFFDTWHRLTLEIFSDPYWEKRDQGTLIAAAWKHGLQEREPLHETFNFIADYYSENLEFDARKGFTRDHFTTAIHPALVHVYHHFGNKNWPVWQWIESLPLRPRNEASI